MCAICRFWGLGALVLVLVLLSTAEGNFKLSGIKSQTVGDGQYGTARWATEAEIHSAYHRVPFQVNQWRQEKNLPRQQSLVLGSRARGSGSLPWWTPMMSTVS